MHWLVKNISPLNNKPPTLLHTLASIIRCAVFAQWWGGLNHFLQSYILSYCLYTIWKTGGRRVLQLLAVELPHLPVPIKFGGHWHVDGKQIWTIWWTHSVTPRTQCKDILDDNWSTKNPNNIVQWGVSIAIGRHDNLLIDQARIPFGEHAVVQEQFIYDVAHGVQVAMGSSTDQILFPQGAQVSHAIVSVGGA
jgi:hypothetical protein